MFDPLHKWLGIPPSEQPPNDYRLLGLATFEDDPDVIDMAADRDLTFLHDLTNGEHGDLAEELSNRISAARLRLLNKQKKAAYDNELRAQQNDDDIDIDSVIDSLGGPADLPTRAPDATSGQPPTSAVPGNPIDVLGMPPGISSPAAIPTTAQVPPQLPPQLPSRSQSQARTGSSRGSSGRRRLSVIWLVGVMPGLIVLGYLLYSIWVGRLHLDPNKLEQLGVPAEQAAQLAGESNDKTKIKASVPATTNSSSLPPSPLPPTDSRPSGSSESTSRSSSPANASPTPSSSPVPRMPGDTITPAIPPPKSPSLAEYLQPADKQPIPSDESIAEKMETVRDLYHDAYLAAKKRDQKIIIADRMRDAAVETKDDPEGQFALYRVARDIFVNEGDFAAAVEIVDLMAESFDSLDAPKLKQVVLAGIDGAGVRAEEYSDVSLALAAEFMNAGRIEDGIAVCKTLRVKVKRIPLAYVARLKELERQLGDAKSLFDRYEQSAMTLEANPNDPDAQAVAGKYLCLVEHRWDDGLPRLANGSDALYRAAASNELALPKRSVSELQVADSWFEVLETSDSDFVKRTLADHARAFYQSARVKTSGLEIRKIDQRLTLLSSLATPGPLNASRIRAEKRAAAAKLKLDAKALALASKPKVLQTRTWDSPSSKTDFATIRNNTLQIGMGNRSTGSGEAAAGVEFENVGIIGVQGAASHATMVNASSMSKTGFFVDYHTSAGYTKRVFLNCDTNTPSYFTTAPPWGAAKQPDARDFLRRKTQYTIDLQKWAPVDWDGRCWFSVYMQNTGMNRTVTATLSWQPRATKNAAE